MPDVPTAFLAAKLARSAEVVAEAKDQKARADVRRKGAQSRSEAAPDNEYAAVAVIDCRAAVDAATRHLRVVETEHAELKARHAESVEEDQYEAWLRMRDDESFLYRGDWPFQPHGLNFTSEERDAWRLAHPELRFPATEFARNFPARDAYFVARYRAENPPVHFMSAEQVRAHNLRVEETMRELQGRVK